uniref:ORF22 n=1 Tax=Nitrosopumilaceae spindle-shaped virus TaxID=3065433 RepID=A0AAT9J7C0_9VIRU
MNCSFCYNELTEKELKYGKSLLFSITCQKCYNKYLKEIKQ